MRWLCAPAVKLLQVGQVPRMETVLSVCELMPAYRTHLQRNAHASCQAVRFLTAYRDAPAAITDMMKCFNPTRWG
jgi:hypothetical protein